MASARSAPQDITAALKIPAERRVNQLTDHEVLQIREMIDRDYQVEGDLRREISMNIKRLMDLGCYRGLRHRRTSGARPAHPHQCPHPQGKAKRDRRQEGRAEGLAPPARKRMKSCSKEAPAAQVRATGQAAGRVRRRERKNIVSGVAHVNASFNNTMITITDAQGNTIAWSSAGPWASRARASRRRTPPRSRPSVARTVTSRIAVAEFSTQTPLCGLHLMVARWGDSVAFKPGL